MDTSKVIRGVANSGKYTVTAPIVKEDYGIYLQIEGVELPETYQVDFSNQEHNGTSVTMIGNADGVLIPHQFIDTGKDIFAFLYHVGADYGRTVYKFRIPNKLRPDRTNEEPTPEEQSVIDQAIAALNDAVEQTAQDVIDAAASASAASQSESNAHDSELAAQGYAQDASGYAQTASDKATLASQKATAASNSADQAAQIKTDIEGYVSTAQGYAQTATDKAAQASQSATNASNSATTASTKAGEASASATTASNKASESIGYATTASNKAGEASGYANTASQKASDASDSATAALGYKIDAESAKTASQTAQGKAEDAQTAAETAQGKAEDAQEAAESAAASVSASAAQIATNAEDISQLKSDLSDLENAGITPDMISKSKLVERELTPSDTYANSYIGGYSSEDLSPLVSSGGTNTVKKYSTEGVSTLIIPTGAVFGGNYKLTLSGYKSDTRPNLFLKGYTVSQLESKPWATVTADTISIDINAMIATESVAFTNISSWDLLQYAYVSVASDTDEVSAQIVQSAGIDDFKWLKESDDTEIIVPKKLVFTDGGIEYNVYKDNCLIGRTIDDIHLLNFVISDGAVNTNWVQDKYRTIWKPNGVVSSHARKMSLFKHDNENVSIEKTINCLSVSAEAGSGRSRKVLVIGDSKVAGGRITQRLYERCDANNMALTMLGSISPWSNPQYAHEGHAGWSAYTYTHLSSQGGVTNPFYHDGGFNFSYYMSSMGYTDVDYIYINLGINDMGDGYGSTFIDNINTMIASIHQYDANIKVIIGICEGRCTRYYSSNILDFNTRLRLMNKASIEEWDDRENENIYICPLYLSIDLYNDFNMTEVPLSQNDEIFNTGKTRWQVDDQTHQSNVGYGKNADYMFATLQYIESTL